MTFSEPTESTKHTLRTVAATLTDTGRTRDHNEDYTKIYIPSDPQVLTTKGALYLVADGLGGHQAGEVASQRASETLIAEYYADEQSDIAASLTQALHNTNTDVYTLAQAKQQRRGMGTTMVAAVVHGREIYLANVGDSRAYLFREGDLRQCTKDHSLVQAQIDAGMLSSEEARHHPQRNVITRSIGHAPQVEVDIFEGQLWPGDILLLCSDGLSGPVQDAEITTLLETYPTPQEAVVQLVNRANERGGPDNISVLLVQVLPYTPDQPIATEVEPERSMLIEATQFPPHNPELFTKDRPGEKASTPPVPSAIEIPKLSPTTLAILAVLVIAVITVLMLWLVYGGNMPLWPF
jgi:serine/threonine protein phosphatase PrpC